MRDAQLKAAKPTKKGIKNKALSVANATRAALARREIETLGDLNFATSDVLNSVVEELIELETPPAFVNWAKFELVVQNMRRTGKPTPGWSFSQPFGASTGLGALSPEALDRLEKITAATTRMRLKRREARAHVDSPRLDHFELDGKDEDSD